MEVQSDTIMNPSSNDDPVTKAVVDNIMGNLPTRKPPVSCDDCELLFTSQAVLDTHLQGARHAKTMRSKNIMASLEETEVPFSKDQETNGLKCNICNVSLNSIQQLQTHLNGSRHKRKVLKGEWKGNGLNASDNSVLSTTSKAQDSIAKTPVILSCDLCNKVFNSLMQYDMHMRSKKHMGALQKLQSKKITEITKGKRFNPYWKKQKPTPDVTDQHHPLPKNSVPPESTE
ncbi:zinc finger protein 346-like [Prorops nasuta]|uniref:zinc finger protein 346-like n=1 Tax=Prorops nasuta TaxID=863751 RepID=UPI0034CEB97B